MSKKLQKVFSVTTSLATILMMSGVAALAPLATNAIVGSINEGATIRVAGTFDIYIAKYVGANQYKRLILNPDVFNSYKHLSWSAVKTVTQAEMDQFTNSNLVRALGDTKVYMLAPNGDVGTKQWLNMTAEQFTACGYDWNSIYVINNVDRDNYTTGTDITGCGATPSPTVTPVAGSIGVSLAYDTPAAATVLAYGTSADRDAQALIPALKLTFTAPSGGNVTVTGLKINRGGISADSDLDNAYLYDGSSVINKLADMQSISNKVITFSNSAGLFTVPAGQTKSVMVRFDLNRNTTNGKTIVLSLNSATDVSSNASGVSGVFPITGNSILTANVTDFGTISAAVVADNSSAVDPGTNGFTAAHFRLTPGSQNEQLEYLKLQLIGSAASTDVINVTLYDGGTQIGSVQQLASDKTVAFDFSASPLVMNNSIVKNLYVKVDVVSGSTRTFQFSLQRGADIVVKDTAYGIYLRPNSGTVGTFSSQSATSVTIGSGALTVSKATDSPTGNIAASATGVTLAKFSMKAAGEDIKVSSIGYWLTSGGGTLKNSKILVDGSQVGTTNTTLSSGVASVVTSTVNFTIPANTTRYLTIVADTTGTAATSTVQITLNGGGSNGQRMSSLGTIAVPSANTNGNTLTLRTGAISVTKNSGFGNGSVAAPTGVVGRTNVKIGSFVVTAGAGEDVNITKVTISDQNQTGYGLNADFQNLKVMVGSTQVGTVIGTLQSTLDYSYDFSSATTLTILNGQSQVFDVYADILTNATHATSSPFEAIRVKTVSATGVSTSADDSYTTPAVDLQLVYLAPSGTLLVENMPASDQVPANMVYASGATNNEVDLYKFKLTAYTESIDVSRVIINDQIISSSVGATTANGKPTTSISLYKLYNGSTLVGSNTLYATSTPVNGGYIDFNIGSATPLNIPAGSSLVLTLRGVVNNYSQISSGSTQQFQLRNHDTIQDTGTTTAIIARGHDSSIDKSGPVSDLATSTVTMVRKAYPVVKDAYGGTLPKLSAGSMSGQSIAKFTVSAVGNDVKLKKMTFHVTLNDTTTSTLLTLSNFKLYRNGTQLGNSEYDIFDGTGTAVGDTLTTGNGGTATLTTSNLNYASGFGIPSSTSTRAVLLFTTLTNLTAGGNGTGEETIASGSTNTYELKSDVANAHQGGTNDSDSIVVTLLGDDTLTNLTNLTNSLVNGSSTNYRYGIITLGAGAASSFSDTNYNFIWSDNSANIGDHVSTIPTNAAGSGGKDWTTGFEVRKSDTSASFLPLDPWIISK